MSRPDRCRRCAPRPNCPRASARPPSGCAAGCCGRASRRPPRRCILTSGYVYSVGGRGGEGVHRRDRPLRLLPLRQPDDLDVRGAAAADRGRARVLCDGDRAWPRCSPRSVRCWPRVTGWSRPAACSAPASWCATRSCRAGASRRCSSTATTCRSGKRRCRKPTQAVFFETPSNPMQSLVDIAAVCELAHAAGAKVVLDNVFATPILQQGFPLGADVVVYSGTKHIDGQGRVLGGAILGDKKYIDEPVQKLMRHTGPALSPFNAWVLLKGLETLAAAGAAPAPIGAAHRRVPREPSRGQLGALPVPGVASAVRPGQAADDRRRHRRHLRAQATPMAARSARSRCSTSCGSSTSPTTSATPSR